jgi:hypothetical protein
MRIDRCRNALEAFEELLHLLLLARLRVLIGGIERILGEAAVGIGSELECLLGLDHAIRVSRRNRGEQTDHRNNSTGALLHLFASKRILSREISYMFNRANPQRLS